MGKNIAATGVLGRGATHGGWDAITVCPADNVGPIQSAHQKDMGPWQHIIEKMLLGKYEQTGAYRPWMIVDVRDDADCHIAMLESVQVKNGERYIAWSTDAINVEDICARIDRVLPELRHDTPRGHRSVSGPHQGARSGTAQRSGPAASCATTASARSRR